MVYNYLPYKNISCQSSLGDLMIKSVYSPWSSIIYHTKMNVRNHFVQVNLSFYKTGEFNSKLGSFLGLILCLRGSKSNNNKEGTPKNSRPGASPPNVVPPWKPFFHGSYLSADRLKRRAEYRKKKQK